MLQKLSLYFVLLLTTAWLASISFASTTFTDVTKEAGVGDEGGGTCVAVGDYDNNGFPDIYVSNGFFIKKETNVLYRNNGDGTFSDVTQEAGVQKEPVEGGCTTFFDYDNDGFLDLYVGNWDMWSPLRDTLFHNNGNGTFTDVAEDAGIEAQRAGGAPTAFDYNNDGLLDIYVCHGAPEPNRLFQNNGDGTFTDVAAKSEVADTSDSIPVICDYDNDGDVDLYLSDYLGSGDGLYQIIVRSAKI